MNNTLQDLHVAGTLTAQRFTPPPQSIGNAAWRDGDYLDARKAQANVRQLVSQIGEAQDQQQVAHVAVAAGQVVSFKAGAVAAALGDAVVTVELLKNGVSVLADPIELNSSQDARQAIAATFDGAQDYDAGDVFEIVITATANGGTLPEGVFASLVARENPQ